MKFRKSSKYALQLKVSLLLEVVHEYKYDVTGVMFQFPGIIYILLHF